MFSGLTARPVRATEYGDRPLTFLDQATRNDLATITGVKRTSLKWVQMCAFDPKRTLAGLMSPTF
jgi:hypothetical protein